MGIRTHPEQLLVSHDKERILLLCLSYHISKYSYPSCVFKSKSQYIINVSSPPEKFLWMSFHEEFFIKKHTPVAIISTFLENSKCLRIKNFMSVKFV